MHPCRLLIKTLLMSCLFFNIQRPLCAESFVFGLDDVPLMPGLEENGDSQFSFDSPAGRVVQSSAVGQQLRKDQVIDFYIQTLLQLGWSYENQGKFTREGEDLYLSFESKEGFLIVSFELRTK